MLRDVTVIRHGHLCMTADALQAVLECEALSQNFQCVSYSLGRTFALSVLSSALSQILQSSDPSQISADKYRRYPAQPPLNVTDCKAPMPRSSFFALLGGLSLFMAVMLILLLRPLKKAMPGA